jgi:hypothetical protein
MSLELRLRVVCVNELGDERLRVRTIALHHFGSACE